MIGQRLSNPLIPPTAAPQSVVTLVELGRFDDALERLGVMRSERRATDDEFASMSRWIRDAALTAYLARVGDRGAVLQSVSGAEGQISTGSDERYVCSLVDGVRTVDRLLDVSTLGHLRTAKALAVLVEQGDVTTVQQRKSSAPEAAGNDGSVIVADSNATQAALTRTMLRPVLGRGAKVVAASSGADVLEQARRSRPMLVVAEFMLPGIDGLELLRRLREDPATAGVPAVLVASRIDAVSLAPRVSAFGTLLMRPFDSNSLREALRSLIEPSR